MSAPAPCLPVTRSLRIAYVLSGIVFILIAVTSVAGLLFGWRGLYTPDPRTLPSFLGQDALSLAVGLPLLAGALWSARRGSLRGLLLWMGTLFYVAYSYAFYALNPEFNVLYVAYLTVVSAALYAFVYLLVSTDAVAVCARFPRDAPVRAVGGFLMAIPVVLGLAWVSMIVATLMSGGTPSRINQVVWPMDLVVAFPAMFWGGVWLWRRQPLGYVVAGALLVKGTFLGTTLVVNSLLATLWDVPLDPALPEYLFGGMCGLVLTVLFLRGLDSAVPSAWPIRRSSAPDCSGLR